MKAKEIIKGEAEKENKQLGEIEKEIAGVEGIIAKNVENMRKKMVSRF